MAAIIRVRVLASVDANLGNVFAPLETAAKRARKRVADDLGAGAQEGAAAYRSLPAKVKPPLEETERAAKKLKLVFGEVADGTQKKFHELSTGLKQLPVDLRAVATAAERELSRIERLRAREMLGLGPVDKGAAPSRAAQLFGSAFGRQLGGPIGGAMGRTAGGSIGLGGMALGYGALRMGMGAIHMGTRLAADVLQGVGVNTDLGSMMQKNVGLETQATNVSAFGFMPGQTGANGKRVDPAELIAEARKTSIATATDPSLVLGGLEKFVGKTGDLKTGREAIADLAKLSKASGANLEQMVSAAGDVSNVLGDIPNKGKAVYEVMKQVAGEGKTGAVLIKDLAVQMAKVAAGAQQFAGDRSTNIGILGAIAQEARGRGGAASATQAATSVSSFVNSLSKGKTIEAYKHFGVDLQDSRGGLRSAEDIMVDALKGAMVGGKVVSKKGKVTHIEGGLHQFGQNVGMMFAESRSRSAVRGFESTFRDAYTSKAGTEQEKLAAAAAAVREEFKRLTSAAMSEKEVQDSFDRAMKTSESKVAIFNERMGEVSAQIQGAVLPALEALAPDALLLAKGFADAVGWMLGVKKPAAVTDPKGAATQAAAKEALELAAKRRAEFHAPTPGPYRRGFGPQFRVVDAAPKPVEMPADTVPVLEEHRVQLTGAAALARGKEMEARRALEHSTGFLYATSANDSNKGTTREQRVASYYERLNASTGPHTASEQTYLDAHKGLASATNETAVAAGVKAAVIEAFSAGNLTVNIGNFKDMPQGGAEPPGVKGSDRQPADSTP